MKPTYREKNFLVFFLHTAGTDVWSPKNQSVILAKTEKSRYNYMVVRCECGRIGHDDKKRKSVWS